MLTRQGAPALYAQLPHEAVPLEEEQAVHRDHHPPRRAEPFVELPGRGIAVREDLSDR
jgi:hypothetical protein